MVGVLQLGGGDRRGGGGGGLCPPWLALKVEEGPRAKEEDPQASGALGRVQRERLFAAPDSDRVFSEAITVTSSSYKESWGRAAGLCQLQAAAPRSPSFSSTGPPKHTPSYVGGTRVRLAPGTASRRLRGFGIDIGTRVRRASLLR